MEPIARYHFQLAFRVKFSGAHGDEFQMLFGGIMNHRYPGDFVQTRPWGRLGDDKCDGYLPSQRKFYQCYAPERMEMCPTLAKLNDDFEGALPMANDFFDVWVFVHNAKEGRLPSWLVTAIQSLRNTHTKPRIETLGYVELLQEVLSLREGTLIDLFGAFPTQGDFLSLSFEDIKPILQFVATHDSPSDSAVSPVPQHKIEYNGLGEDERMSLVNGMRKARLVRDYLDGHPDKELPEKVASCFRQKYDQLKAEGLEPNSILYELQIAAQGPYVQRPRQEAAALAVLAHLFEKCDIFESPPAI
jgi:hypothetical protein